MNENLFGVLIAAVVCIVLLMLGCFLLLITIFYDLKSQIDKLKKNNSDLKSKLYFVERKSDYFELLYRINCSRSDNEQRK